MTIRIYSSDLRYVECSIWSAHQYIFILNFCHYSPFLAFAWFSTAFCKALQNFISCVKSLESSSRLCRSLAVNSLLSVCSFLSTTSSSLSHCSLTQSAFCHPHPHFAVARCHLSSKCLIQPHLHFSTSSYGSTFCGSKSMTSTQDYS